MNKKRKRQILTGRVISGEMSKTVNVRVTREIPHPVYKKRVKRYKNYLAHVESVAPKILCALLLSDLLVKTSGGRLVK